MIVFFVFFVFFVANSSCPSWLDHSAAVRADSLPQIELAGAAGNGPAAASAHSTVTQAVPRFPRSRPRPECL